MVGQRTKTVESACSSKREKRAARDFVADKR